MKTKNTTVLLADDHDLPRRALREILENAGGFEVVAEAADGRTAVHLAHELEPDVVVMDVVMPELNGIEATRRLVAALPRSGVLAISFEPRSAREILAAGAAGFLLKEDAAEELVAAVRAVAAGERYLSRELDEPPTDPEPAT